MYTQSTSVNETHGEEPHNDKLYAFAAAGTVAPTRSFAGSPAPSNFPGATAPPAFFRFFRSQKMLEGDLAKVDLQASIAQSLKAWMSDEPRPRKSEPPDFLMKHQRDAADDRRLDAMRVKPLDYRRTSSQCHEIEQAAAKMLCRYIGNQCE